MARVFSILLCLLSFALFQDQSLFAENPLLYLGLDSRWDVVYTKDPRFPTKTQTDIALGGFLEVTPLSFFGFGIYFGHHWTQASNFDGGFLYRAYSGSDLRLYLTARFLNLVQNEQVFLLLGSNQGALLRFDTYQLTPLSFFYMGFFIRPFLELNFASIPYLGIQLGIPFDYYFRKDLDLSTSLGIVLSLKFAPLRKSWAKGTNEEV